MYIGDWIDRGATYWPEKLAIVDVAKGEQGCFTYAQLNERANRLANWLQAEVGVRPGDRVGMLALNGVEYLDLFFACNKLGAILSPYNWRLHPQELTALMHLTAPKALFYSDDFCPQVAQAAGVDLAYSVSLEGVGVPGSLSYQTVLQNASAQPLSQPTLTEEDIICLLFTGGTTGLPKAAQINYRMITWNTLNYLIHELNRDDVTVTHLPLFHAGGLLAYTLPFLIFGGTVVIMRRWDPVEALRLIERERATMFLAIPTQYQQMYQAANFATTDFSSLRYITCGGASLPVPLIRAWRAVHEVPFKQGYGLTEFGPGVFSMGPEHAESKAGSIGRVNYFIEAKLVDNNNQPVPTGEVGELLLRGPVMFSGYFNDPPATAAAIDSDGWLHTGDMARLDTEGFCYIVDRRKDMFISGGENVYPVEIERALYEHPAVYMCAVIGVPDQQWGEVGQACVILQPNATATAAELLDFLRARLARYKVPKTVAFMTEFPLSTAGKILKRELQQQFVAEQQP